MVSLKRSANTSDEEEEVAELLVQSNQRQASGPSTKRARVNGHSDSHNSTSPPELTRLHPETSDDEEDEADELATPAPPSMRGGSHKNGSRGANGNNSRVQQLDADADMGSDVNSDDEEEENDGVREAALTDKTQQEGAIAEAGVVHSVILRNFMCHKHLEITLHPQINFIIGHNGSGKSVILTGIAFAFGTKASLTNRGKSLKSLIKDEGPWAEVTVSLRNRGAEAFRSDIYGSKIYITRRINSEGGTTYKIAGHDKRAVSTKRSELSAICDHFQIQVDNPVNILHQDNAKLFLHSSKPQDKYRFFLKGTQLEQLADEYQKIWEQCNYISNEVKLKKERLEELKTNMKQAQAAWKEIEAAKNVEHSIRDMKNQLAWTLVVDIEKRVHETGQTLAVEAEKLAKVAKKLRESQKEFDSASAKLVEAHAQQEHDGELEDLETEVNNLEGRLKQKLREIKAVKAQQEEMKQSVKRLQQDIQQHDREIAEAQSRTDGALRAQLEASQERLRQIEEEKANVERAMQESRTKADEAIATMTSGRAEFEAAREEQNAARRSLEQADGYLRSLEASRSNSLNAFGNNAAAIVSAINREEGWRQKPIGPIGQHIKLKDSKWSRVCEDVLGDVLNSFICVTWEDKMRLMKLMRRFTGGRPHQVHTITPDPRFEADLQSKLPDETRFRTLLNVLSIDHPLVRQAVVDLTRGESTALVTEAETPAMEDLLRDDQAAKAGIHTAITQMSYRLGGMSGGSRSVANNQYKGPPRLTKDVEADRLRATQQRAEAENQLRSANEKRAHLDRLLAGANSQKTAAEAAIVRNDRFVRQLMGERERLMEAAQDFAPADIQALQQARTTAQEEIDSITAQGQAGNETIANLYSESKPIIERKEAVQALLLQREAIRQSQAEVLEKLVTTKTEREHEVAQYTRKQQDHQARYDAETAKIDAVGRDLEEAMAQARAICPRENVDLSKGKTVKKLEREINSLEKALRENERRMGGSSEEIHARYMEAKRLYETNDSMIKDLKRCGEMLRVTYEHRVDRWAMFRQHISTRARMLFVRFLFHRGYSGDLKFKHDEHKLELRVLPIEGADKKQVQKSKDASTLSGGEKSFSTICLLLALWHAAGCPIRGLDEYDVFMDAVNRKIATKMLIDAGKAQNNVQMILISPQALQMNIDPTHVKIHRIADPERGQGTLSTHTTG